MKTITIRYPDDVSEEEACNYALGCFNSRKHDYRNKPETGKHDASCLTFGDGRVGLYYRNRSGYVLELHGMEAETE